MIKKKKKKKEKRTPKKRKKENKWFEMINWNKYSATDSVLFSIKSFILKFEKKIKLKNIQN